MSENVETTIVENQSNVILIEDAMKNLQTRSNLSIKSITKFIIANDQVDDARFFSSIKKSVLKRRQMNEAQNKVADKRTSTKPAKKVATKVKRSKRSTKIEIARKIKRSISIDSKITNPKLHICIVDKFNRRSKLLEMLSKENRNRAVVFVDSSRTADFLAGYLSESGIPTSSIHAERWPWQRYEVLHDFKIGRMKAIIATTEGLHELKLPQMDYVIHYDMPTIDEYKQRMINIIRTDTITFFEHNPIESALLRGITFPNSCENSNIWESNKSTNLVGIQ